jgi:hypothetical protein
MKATSFCKKKRGGMLAPLPTLTDNQYSHYLSADAMLRRVERWSVRCS